MQCMLALLTESYRGQNEYSLASTSFQEMCFYHVNPSLLYINYLQVQYNKLLGYQATVLPSFFPSISFNILPQGHVHESDTHKEE